MSRDTEVCSDEAASACPVPPEDVLSGRVCLCLCPPSVSLSNGDATVTKPQKSPVSSAPGKLAEFDLLLFSYIGSFANGHWGSGDACYFDFVSLILDDVTYRPLFCAPKTLLSFKTTRSWARCPHFRCGDL